MLVVDESTCVIGLMGLILSLTEEILRLGTPLRFFIKVGRQKDMERIVSKKGSENSLLTINIKYNTI